MKLSGRITLELEVEDFSEAAQQQRQLEQLVEQIRLTYPRAVLEIRGRRERRALTLDRDTSPVALTGAVRAYRD